MLAGIAPSDLLGWLVTVGGIILVDLALSGDNALIIGAAASRLPRRQRLIALFWGGLGAIVLRIALTTIASRLLLIPLVQSVGAAVIMIITIRMLIPEDEGAAAARAARSSDRLGAAIVTILAADVSMSLDNVLAIGALSRGNMPLLVFGLLLSMLLLLTASAVVARLIERFNWLMDLTALALAYTAGDLALHDPVVSGALGLTGGRALELIAGLLVFTVLLAVAFRIARAQHTRRAHGGHAGSAQAPAGSQPADAQAPEPRAQPATRSRPRQEE
ncbi:MAG TPA: YjbE family putative metal transport protein [Ktedonobacterales bacterium]|nr:YjbE family putative metal transport protein [Ktedonobacterales bacterium]